VRTASLQPRRRYCRSIALPRPPGVFGEGAPLGQGEAQANRSSCSATPLGQGLRCAMQRDKTRRAKTRASVNCTLAGGADSLRA